MSNYQILTDQEVEESLQSLPDWSKKKEYLTAQFEFEGFSQVIAFVMQVALLAEKMNHHPEFSVSYNKVKFSYCTHDAGFRITDIDIKMAKKISQIVGR